MPSPFLFHAFVSVVTLNSEDQVADKYNKEEKQLDVPTDKNMFK